MPQLAVSNTPAAGGVSAISMAGGRRFKSSLSLRPISLTICILRNLAIGTGQDRLRTRRGSKEPSSEGQPLVEGLSPRPIFGVLTGVKANPTVGPSLTRGGTLKVIWTVHPSTSAVWALYGQMKSIRKHWPTSHY